MTRIGIDYTPAYEQGGGIGRYVRELTAGLATLDRDNAYRLFIAGTPTPPTQQLAPNFKWASTRLTNKWLARIWHRARIPLPIEQFTGPLDLFHATDFVLPPTRPQTRTLLTVHDLSYIKTPETAAPRLRAYLERVVPRSLRQADHILADSQATKDDLLTHYSVDAQKVTVLLSGVSDNFRPVDDAERLQAVRQRYELDDRPYIFSIGTVQPRKNYPRLVRAVKRLRDHGHDLQLVIAGGRGWLEDETHRTIRDIDMSSHVRLIGFARDEDIAALYSGAIVTAFVSLYEGFGLPVLESMACGTPVVTSNVSSLPEVAGDVAPMVNPRDDIEIADALARVISDKSYHDQLRERGLDHVRRFTWERAARQLLDVYDQVLHD